MGIFALTIVNNRKISIQVEEDEYERAKRNALRNALILTEENEKYVTNSIVNASRKMIGTAIIIEGDEVMSDIEDSGDSFGFGTLESHLLTTMIESEHMNKGAILIRRNHIVAYNCKMPIYKHEVIANHGGGNRHFGAMGTMLEYPSSTIIVVSGTTGKISLFGHVHDETSIDYGLSLKERDIYRGVSPDQIQYRLHTLLTNQGLLEDLNSPEVERDIMIQKETREEKRARLKQERAEKEEQKQRKKEQMQEERTFRERERDLERSQRELEKKRKALARRGEKERERKKKQAEKEKRQREKMFR